MQLGLLCNGGTVVFFIWLFDCLLTQMSWKKIQGTIGRMHTTVQSNRVALWFHLIFVVDQKKPNNTSIGHKKTMFKSTIENARKTTRSGNVFEEPLIMAKVSDQEQDSEQDKTDWEKERDGKRKSDMNTEWDKKKVRIKRGCECFNSSELSQEVGHALQAGKFPPTPTPSHTHFWIRWEPEFTAH